MMDDPFWYVIFFIISKIIQNRDREFISLRKFDSQNNKSVSKLLPKSVTTILLIWDLTILIATVTEQISALLLRLWRSGKILIDFTMLSSCLSSQRQSCFSPCVFHVLCQRHVDHLAPPLQTSGSLWRRSNTFFFSVHVSIWLIF